MKLLSGRVSYLLYACYSIYFDGSLSFDRGVIGPKSVYKPLFDTLTGLAIFSDFVYTVCSFDLAPVLAIELLALVPLFLGSYEFNLGFNF